MPLIILSGYPCSGRTTRALELEKLFSVSNRPQDLPSSAQWPTSVHIVNDQSLSISPSHYHCPKLEKNARSAMLSTVERLLSKNVLVIADAMNYIKGFRYQLYCIARTMGTPHCVIYCAAPADLARQWNSARAENDHRYDLKTFDELVSRFEEPNGNNRWDAPLFFTMYTEPTLPFGKLVAALILRIAAPPYLSTVVKPLTETNYLYELEKSTNELVAAYFKSQNDYPPGSLVSMLDCVTKIRLPGYKVSLPQLKSYRRQFLSVNTQRTVTDLTKLKELFITYLHQAINQ